MDGSGRNSSSDSLNVNSQDLSTNAKIASIRKELKKDLSSKVPFLKLFAKKISSFKNPTARIQTLEAIKYATPKYASIDTSLIPKKILKRVNLLI